MHVNHSYCLNFNVISILGWSSDCCFTVYFNYMTFTCWCRVLRMQSGAVRRRCITRAHNPRANIYQRKYTRCRYVVTRTVLNFYRALTAVTRARELCPRPDTRTLRLGTCKSGGAAVAVGTSPEHSLTREVKRARADRRHMAIPRVVYTNVRINRTHNIYSLSLARGR